MSGSSIAYAAILPYRANCGTEREGRREGRREGEIGDGILCDVQYWRRTCYEATRQCPEKEDNAGAGIGGGGGNRYRAPRCL
eukprot:823379-Rhodomonas_salina.2